MQVYSHIAENWSHYRKPQRYIMLRGAVQSVCIHVELELGELLCDAVSYLGILCAAPCCSQMREQRKCYC